MRKLTISCYILVLIIFMGCVKNSHAQSLQNQLNSVFSELLELNLSGSPGAHGNHFRPSNVAASASVINALNSFIGTSISSFPLSSTVAGLTFDFSSGRPVSTSTSLGPIFSERAQTLGQGLITVGFNFSHIKFTKMRGINLEDMRLSFTHQDVGGPGMGNSPFEFDYIDLLMDMEVSANILALYFTYGITDRLDISVAIPMVNVALKSTPYGIMNSYTFVNTDTAFHSFGGPGTETDPVLESWPAPIDDDATGVGDIALRLKYNFLNSADIDLSALLEYRLATGDEKDFLGSGNSSMRLAVILSKIIGDFAPHVNLAYEIKNSDDDLDELEIYLGYDQKISESLTFAVDFIGEYEVGGTNENLSFPKSVEVNRNYGPEYIDDGYTQIISLTNIPDFKNDNLVNGAVGFKFKPKENLMIIGNVFFPLNDGGLRADFIPTFGVEFSF